MSTSLEKDLHSVYIDGEMPESFVAEYEKRVSSNEAAARDLQKIKALHSVLREDSNEKTVPAELAEKSFGRLQTKMRYARTVSLSSGQNPLLTPLAKYAASFVTAAAVFAVIFIPVHYNSLANAKETAVAAISIMKENNIEPIAKKDVVVDGNIKKEDLPKVLAVTSKKESAAGAAKPAAESNFVAAAESAAAPESAVPQREQKTIYATNLASGGGASSLNSQFRRRLTSVDPFVPDFSSSSLTISVPNFHEIGHNIEMMNQQE